MDELLRCREAATRNKLSMNQYLRMLVAKDHDAYKSHLQEATEWLLEGKGHEPTVSLDDLTDRQPE